MSQVKFSLIKTFSVFLEKLMTSCFWFMVLVSVLVGFVPFLPGMPSPGLDQSWVFAMNQAVSQGLAFGKDVVFTFGPYAFVMDKGYHPSTDLMMICGSLYLAISYFLSVSVVIEGVRWFWKLAFLALVGGLCFQQDVLFYSFPFLVGLAAIKLAGRFGLETPRSVRFDSLYLVFIFSPLGFLPLIKGNLLVLCGVIAVLFAASMLRRNIIFAVIAVCSPLASVLIFWLLSGQDPAGMLQYFLSLVPIISGYTDAMSVDGYRMEIFVFVFACLFLLLSIITGNNTSSSSRWLLLLIYSGYLFFVFKAGFVRHDGHAVISGLSLIFAAILLPFFVEGKIVELVVTIAVLLGYFIAQHHMDFSTRAIISNFKTTYVNAWQGFVSRIDDPNRLKRDFDLSVISLRTQASLPLLPGSADIYSFNQSSLIASGNLWSPRPVFQSFAAYTPELAMVNRDHLLGRNAPDNVFFKVETIGGRLPSLDDGVSWPVLMFNYQPTRMSGDYVFLKRRGGVIKAPELLSVLQEQHKFGDVVSLPDSGHPIFAQVHIEPTILGRLARIAFKSSYLTITTYNVDGIGSQYRLIAGMAKSGFLISPLIENTTEFSMLYAGGGKLVDKRVKSIVITSGDDGKWLWNREYSIAFSQIEAAPPVDISNIALFDGFEDRFKGVNLAEADQCDGVIDSINSAAFAPRGYSASALLSISGWLAISVKRGILPSAVYVTLTDDHGGVTYIKTRRMPRPDVGEYFNQPVLIDSGYSAIGDLSSIKKGVYSLGLAIEASGRIAACPKYNVKFEIK